MRNSLLRLPPAPCNARFTLPFSISSHIISINYYSLRDIIYRGDDEGVADVCRVVDAEPDDEDDGDAGDGVDGQAPEVDQPHHVHQRERHARQHQQANLEAEGRNYTDVKSLRSVVYRVNHLVGKILKLSLF